MTQFSKIRGIPRHQNHQRAALACAVLVFLSACADGTSGSDDAELSADESPLSAQQGAPLSAAELNDDPRTTLSYAQAVAAGLIEHVVPDVTDVTDVASTNDSNVADNSTPTDLPPVDAVASIDESDNVDSQPALGAATPEANTEEETVDATNSTDTTNSANNSPEAVDLSESNSEESTIGQRFTSHTTDGFEGVVTEDGSSLISWETDRSARGYNIYRDGDYVLSVYENEWLDTDTVDDDYYYEIEKFDFADTLSRVATGLTVKVRGSGREGPARKTTGVDLDEYELVFSDEFQGTSLDFSKWATSYLWGPNIIINSEEQYYVDTRSDPDFGYDPFKLDGEVLTINSVPTPAALSDKALGQPYLSGVITSRDAFNFTYGYAEARARTPFGRGFWSAFWLLNTNYDGGDEPEIDIMEHIGHNQDTAYHTYHYYDHSGDTTTLHSTESMPVTGIDYTSDFHTFAVDWSPGTLVFYVDGVETHRINDPRVSNVDMYVIANTAIGGWWPGSPDATTEFPAEYALDYIRVYQRITPYDDQPFFNDAPSRVPAADTTPGTAPSRRPSFEQWPQGYPAR